MYLIHVDRKKEESSVLYLSRYSKITKLIFFLKNLTLLYFRLELQGSLGKRKQLASLLDFMSYIRRPCFPWLECKRKWKLWASLKSWKCSMCQFHSHNTWIKSLVWGHLANKTRLFSTLQIFLHWVSSNFLFKLCWAILSWVLLYFWRVLKKESRQL